MTTLPQTTPLRLPRPAQGPQLAVPGVMTAGGQGGGASLGAADIWRIIRSNLLLIIALLVVALICGYAINSYLARYYSKYTTSALIQIQPPISGNPLKQAVNDDHNIYADQRTQVQLLHQETLISRVLQNSDSAIRKTEWFSRFPAERRPQLAKNDIMENFSANLIPETRLISVVFSGPIPKETKIILEEIVSQHLDDQQQLQRTKSYDRSVQLNNLKMRYSARLRDLSQDVRDKQVRLSVDGASSASGRLNTKEVELSKLVEDRVPIEMNANAAKTAYEDVTSRLQRGEDPPQVEQAIAADEEIKKYTQNINDLDIGLAESRLKLGDKHPIVESMEKRKQMYQEKLEKTRAEVAAKVRSELVDRLRSQLAETKRYLDQLDKHIDDIRADLGELNNAMATYLTLQDEERGVRELLKQVNDQLDDINQTTNILDNSTVAWVTKPPIPDTPSFPVLANTMSAAVAMALALGLGIAFLRELLDTTVRSPRDIVRVGQMNLLGTITDDRDDPQSEGARLPLVIFEAPHSIMAEQFRQVRTRLQHAASLDTTRTLLITAPSPRDGKTTVTCNLAAGLALNGRKILLVDADFRRPEIYKIFGMSNDVGLSDVLTGQTPFENAVQESAIPNLSVMVSGPKPPNATELFESRLYTDFIERALEEFDHVIFDSGPFLVVSESFALAPRVDGVVTVVRAHNDSRGVLQRMRDALRQVKAEHLGVVLNAVRAHSGGYYGRNIKTYYAYQSDTVARTAEN